jgi:phage protein D
MPGGYTLLLNGCPADADLYASIATLEVEESMDLPAALQLKLPVVRTGSGEFTYLSDARFQPIANLSVIATPGSGGADGTLDCTQNAVGAAFGKSPTPQCIFDGYALSHKIHLESGTTNSALTVWGQDISWLMNLTEKVREWVNVTDTAVANQIFNENSINPSDQNTDDVQASHVENGRSLMQRGSDIQFLRSLARRNGKVCRIACADKPGARVGYFAKPKVDGNPAVTLTLTDVQNWTVNAIDLEWDATRPTAVIARQALFNDSDPNGVSADTSDSGLAALSDRTLAAFTGQPMTVLLAAPVDNAGELTLRAQSLLRETGWFVRCEGEADVERLGLVLRAGMVVAIAGIGALHSGRYLVWTVRHTITADAHTMKFTLVRNAVGKSPSNGADGLAAAIGGM